MPGHPYPTPTKNLVLPFRRGGFSTLWEALEYAARGETGLNFFNARGELTARLSYTDLRLQALRFAHGLIAGGLARGDRLVVLADTWPGFCVAFFGAQYAGVVPVPAALPVGFGARNSYVAQLRGQIATAGAAAVVAPEDMVCFAAEAAAGIARLVGTVDAFPPMAETRHELEPLGPGEQCYIQFTSGSTRCPRGVDVHQAQLMANIDTSIARQELNEDDSGVSWLPFYHDMGLIGFVLAPMCAQRSVDLMAPRDFARRPLQWLSMISRRRATITYSPGFGYALAARRAQAGFPVDIELSCLKIAGVGAEMIQPAILRRFAETFSPCGFNERAFMPSYGMAEVCVGLALGRRFNGFRTEGVGNRELVSCGQALEHHQLEIRGDDGTPLPEGRIGRIFVKGPSVMVGYFLNESETDRVLNDGWLETGDLGYSTNGELIVAGRSKDLIIVNGRNIWPQDIEWAVERLARLRLGDACVFSVDGLAGEEVVVLVQCFPGQKPEIEELVANIRQVVKQTAGVDCRIVLLPRRIKLPQTSSGKLSRALAKRLFLNDELDLQAAIS